MITTYFYSHFSTDPVVNMAFDCWMFNYVQNNPGALLLRLYSWSEGAITIGYHQHAEKAVQLSKLGGTSLIRRITGGRAVYHDQSELTYSIAINPHHPSREQFTGSVTQVHKKISESLQIFLKRLGVISDIVSNSPSQKLEYSFSHTLPCFESHARHELTSNGRKIVASAQRQQDGVLLQHGSIKRSGIVNHPAIAFQLENCGKSLQAIEREEFESLSTEFKNVMASTLQLKFLENKESLEPINFVNQAYNSIINKLRKNPLKRSDLFKQDALPKSL